MNHNRKVGPGIVNLTGDQEIDEIVPSTTLTITDGALKVGIMSDDVIVKTQRVNSIKPLDIYIKYALGTGEITSANSLKIQEHFKDKLILRAVNDIYAANIGNESQLITETGKIVCANIGEMCEANAAQDIEARIVGHGSVVESLNGKIKVSAIQNTCQVRANSNLIAGDVGSGCTLSSSKDYILVDSVGSCSYVQAYKSVKCSGVVGVDCAIESESEIVVICGKVLEGAAIKANKSILAASGVGVAAALWSKSDWIDVCGVIDTQASIKASKGIRCRLVVIGNGVQMLATDGPIEVLGDIYSNAYLVAKNKISCKSNIGNKAKLECPEGEINIYGRVSKSATFIAAKVNINQHISDRDRDHNNDRHTDAKDNKITFFNPKVSDTDKTGVSSKSLNNNSLFK